MRRSKTNSRLARSAASVLEMLEQRMLFNAATLVKTDTTTAGTWTGKYGTDGYSVVGGNTALPSYATLSVAGDQFYEWEAPGTSDLRAPQTTSGSSTRVAAGDYSNSGSFSVDVNVTDGQTHQVAIYVLDEDFRNRSETVTATDPLTNNVLSTTDVKNFTGGEYLVYNVSGHVQFTISNDPGSLNCVMSGVFFDSASGTGTGTGTTMPGAATYINTDTTTKGTWTGVYGSDGYSVVGGSTSLPSYATFGVTGDDFYEWEGQGTTDPRALQVLPGTPTRVAACDYTNSGSFTVTMNVNGTSKVALYLLDEDLRSRSETIQITDATTNKVLSTQDFTNFTGGVYAVYTISGDVKVNLINDGPPSLNVVLSGIFFSNGTGNTGPTDRTVGVGEQYSTIQAAVNASKSGDTIDVYSGTYTEQVTIPAGLNNLTVEAAMGASATIQAPSTLDSTGAIVHVAGAFNTNIAGFAIMGPGSTQGALKFGVLVDDGGSANILNNNISKIQDATFPTSGDPNTNNNGRGVAVTNGSANISGNIISSYQKAGVLIGLTPDVTGSATWQQAGTVENNVITGIGATTQVSQYGIEFSGPRATGTAQNNRVSGNQFTNAQTTGNAGGIIVYNAGQISILSNVVYNNDTNIIVDGGQGPGGVLLDGSNGTNVAGNQVYNSTYFDGIDLVDGVTRVYVTWNYAYGNAVDGIFCDGSSTGNYFTNNLVMNNANYDIEDVTYSPNNDQGSPTFGTQNFYYKDQFGTTNDPALVSTSYN